MHRARIDHADLSEADKRLILRDNALKLFGASLAACSKQVAN
jgi:predicted TIM-barrel fold metal-dependent hydrolase